MPEPAHKRQLTSTFYATPLMTPTTALGLFVRLSIFELRETGDWDIFLGPPEQARAKTGGADQCVLKRRELPGFAIVNEKKRPHPWDTHHQFSIKTLLSKKKKNIPLSVFNKNSTLKPEGFLEVSGRYLLVLLLYFLFWQDFFFRDFFLL